jgi:hypothetical protein
MIVLGILVTTAIDALWGGFVLTKLWAWFVVPTFHLPELTLPVAIGLTRITLILTSKLDLDIETHAWTDILSNSLSTAIATPLAALVLGAIAHSYM